MSRRIMPAEIKIGSTVTLEFALPMSPEGETWASASLRMRRIRDTEVTVFVDTDDTLAESMAMLEIEAATTTTMADGAYRYSITCTGSGGFVANICHGVVSVIDPLDPKRNDLERMTDIAKYTLEQRMTNSGDVASYSIAGRQVNMIPLDEHKQLVYDYEERLQRQRNPKQYFMRRRIRY